jgi:hypothetical protein
MFFMFFMLFFVLLFVFDVFAAYHVMDVAMVSSPQVGRGYHSALMIDNKTYTKVSRSALRTLSQPTNQLPKFLSRVLEFVL